jgi:hypothetical protein
MAFNLRAERTKAEGREGMKNRVTEIKVKKEIR